MRKILTALALFAGAACLSADVVTLPAVASIQGGNPFFSDVRAFNTSYASSLDVTATYRCFIATVACPAAAPQLHFTLAPRESRAFNDMVASADGFDAHDTAGGVEFESSGSEGQLLVTSRLFSTSPLNSVGMFIPGLTQSKAHAVTVLSSIRHDPPNSILPGFRTNVGVFNPGDSSAVATMRVFDFDGQALGQPVVRTVPPHSGVQVSGIFEAAGLANVVTQNATIVVTSTLPLFSYAAVLDNRTADPIFVVGAPDQSSGPATPTPTGPTATRTPTQPGPSPTKTQTPMMGASPTPTRTPTRTATQTGPSPTPTQPGPSATPTATVPGPSATQTATTTAPAATSTQTATRTPSRTPTPTTTPSGVTHDVSISNFMFSPSTVNIAAGDSVRWTWAIGTHTTTSGACPGGVCADDGIWDSHSHSAGFFFIQNFPTSGSFPYHCDVHHAMMQGTVVVAP